MVHHQAPRQVADSVEAVLALSARGHSSEPTRDAAFTPAREPA
jgi:hypothetical protein